MNSSYPLKPLRALHNFSNKKWLGYFLAFVVFWLIWNLSHASTTGDPKRSHWAWEWLCNAFICALLMTITLGATQRLSARLPHWALAATIGIAVALAFAVINWLIFVYWIGWPTGEICCSELRLSTPVHIATTAGNALMSALGMSFVYFYREHAFQSRLRLREAETARAHASQRLTESRLLAMQAQVEPAFLLSALRRVESLYDAEPERAERALDQLITYLRAAMPLMRSSTSTLERESVLVGSYLDVLSALLNEKIVFSFSVNAEHRNLKFPPMICLPLAAELASARVHASSIHIMASVSVETVSVSAVYSPQSGALEIDNPALAQIKERLAALFGDHAQLTHALRGDQLSEIKISVPNTTSSDNITNPLSSYRAAPAERRTQPRATAH